MTSNISRFTQSVFAASVLLSSALSAETLSVENTEVAPATLAKKVQTIVSATATKRVPPKYPINEARSGRDGWVRLSFVVEPDGSTSNIIVEESSGSKSFEREAIKATKKWQYTPAIENGKAIQQCNNSVQLDFRMHRKEGVSRKFNRLYRNFTEALNEKDEERVAALYPKMRDYQLYARAESYFQYSALAAYESEYGTKEQQYHYLIKAMRFSDSSDYFKSLKKQERLTSTGIKVKQGVDADKEIKQTNKAFNDNKERNLAPILHQKLVLELDLNYLHSARYTLNQLLLLSVNSENHAIYQQQADAIENFIVSDSPILTPGSMKKRDFWYHSLIRNEFAFTHINGNLHKIDVRCSNKRHVYTVTEQSTWKIPSSWNNCSIYVYGDDNTTFTLVETNPLDTNEINDHQLGE